MKKAGAIFAAPVLLLRPLIAILSSFFCICMISGQPFAVPAEPKFPAACLSSSEWRGCAERMPSTQIVTTGRRASRAPSRRAHIIRRRMTAAKRVRRFYRVSRSRPRRHQIKGGGEEPGPASGESGHSSVGGMPGLSRAAPEPLSTVRSAPLQLRRRHHKRQKQVWDNFAKTAKSWLRINHRRRRTFNRLSVRV